MEKFALIINGEQVKTEKYFDVINPATFEVVGKCPSAEYRHLDQAVAAAQKAFPTWSTLDDSIRVEKLQQIAIALEQNQDELMKLLTLEMGKPEKLVVDFSVVA